MLVVRVVSKCWLVIGRLVWGVGSVIVMWFKLLASRVIGWVNLGSWFFLVTVKVRNVSIKGAIMAWNLDLVSRLG